MECSTDTVPLGDLVTMTSGGTPDKKKPDYWGGPIPWISAKTLKGDYISSSNLSITEQGLESSTAKLAPEGSLLLLTRGSGLFKHIPLAVVERPVAYNQDIKCITSKKPGISNRYLFYALKALEPTISGMLETTGIGAGKLSTDLLERLPMPVLKEDSRQKAVAFFDALTMKLAINQRINGYLGALCEGIAMRQRGISIKLEDLCHQVVDKRPCSEAELSNYVSTESLLANKGGRQPASSLPTTGNVSEYKTGDTLVSNIRPYFKKIWFADRDGTCSGDVIVFRAHDEHNAPYVYSLLRTDAFFDYVMLGSKGTKMPRGDKKQMMTYSVPSACDEVDLNLLASATARLQTNDQQNAILSELRDALLPKLMSGEIDVSKVPQPIQRRNHVLK